MENHAATSATIRGMSEQPIDLWKASTELVESQIKRLIGIADSGTVDLRAVSKEAAILQAFSARESTLGLMAMADILDTRIKLATQTGKEATDSLNARLDTLTSKIDTFTTKADEGTGHLVTWTKVLAVGTVLLAFATIGLVYATISAEPAQIITVGKP